MPCWAPEKYPEATPEVRQKNVTALPAIKWKNIQSLKETG